MHGKMVEKGLEEEYDNGYAKANNKYINDFDKNKESSYLNYQDVNNLFGWPMLQELPVNGFKQFEELLDLMKASQKILMKKGKKDIFLKFKFNMQKTYVMFKTIYFFYLNE